ncbi:MAG: 30S ribosomal protein S5 [Candidatus Norongarragalinales archaeon]
MGKSRGQREEEEPLRLGLENEAREWVPRTELGKKVLAGEYATLEDVFNSGRKILEPQIIDFLLKGQLVEEVMEVKNTQRMTGCGRKMLMRAVVLVGNRGGYVGVGVGKAPESRDAINEAILDAKKNIIRVRLGCGSWECGCGRQHTVPREVRGSNGSTHIRIKPAPAGVGIVAGETTKRVLELAGVRDAWSFAKGRTRNVLNTILATIAALDSLNKLKKGVGATTSEEKKEKASTALSDSGGEAQAQESVEVATQLKPRLSAGEGASSLEASTPTNGEVNED